MKKTIANLAVVAVFASSATAMAGNSGIKIVGSSTVYPFSTVAAERFSQITGVAAPTVESTGSGGGMKLFCAGVGAGAPDITNASRRMKKSEQDKCKQNGVADVVEVKIGYDGIVFAQALAGKELRLSRRDIFMALGRQVPNADGKLVNNPNKTWRDVNPEFPDVAIRVYGPPPTSGTRDAFAELALEKGCASFAELKALKKSDKKRYKAVCHGVREDGAYVESGENDNIIIQKLVAAPNAFGVFGYSFLEENRDKVRGATMEGVTPNFDSIAAGAYPVSRPLFFYVKKAHYGKTPNLEEFAKFFVRPEVMGEDGFLAERGLIPLPDKEYSKTANAVKNAVNMENL
jgi:phosphate transport system substrate-binding protein